MRIWRFMVVVSLLWWAASSVQNASAESAAAPESSTVIKPEAGAKGKDPVTRRLESLTRQLGLSPDQQEKIKPILQDEADKLKELRAKPNQTTADKKAQLQDLRQATLVKIRPILTSDQQIKQDEQIKKATERRKSKENQGLINTPAN